MESYCCPISVNPGSTWNGKRKAVASGPGLLSSTGFLSPPAPRGLEQVGPVRFVGSVSSIPQRFFGPALTCRPFFYEPGSVCPGRGAAWSEAERCTADPGPYQRRSHHNQ